MLDDVFDVGVGLISAGAGHGKTTLLSSWLAQSGSDVDVAWLSLEAEHDDPVVLGADLRLALRSPGDPAAAPVSHVLAEVAQQVRERDRRLLLVLDDTHRVSSSGIWGAFAALLERRPPGLLVVLSGREDPALPLSGMRARGEMIELRSRDLLFSPAEARALFDQRFGLHLPEDRVDELRGRTEGWVTGLCLTGLAMRGAGDPLAVLDDHPAQIGYINDYLEEVLVERLPDELVAFLETTAVLRHLDAEVCAHLTGRDDALDVLNGLVARNLFTEQTTVDPPTFRYHSVFASWLRERLNARDPERARALLASAIPWYEERGMAGAAIDLAVRSGDVQRATRLIRSACGRSMRLGYAATVVRWLTALPADVVWTDPELTVVLGLASGLTGDLPTAETASLTASKVVDAMTDPPPGLVIGVTYLEGLVRFFDGDMTSPELNRALVRCLELYDVHTGDPLLEVFAVDHERLTTALAISHLLRGQFDRVADFVDAALEPDAIVRSTRFAVVGLGVRALALALAGDRDHARQAVRQGRRALQGYNGHISDAFPLQIARAWLSSGPDADAGLAAARAIAERVPYVFVRVLVSLAAARLHLRRGEPTAAEEALRHAETEIADLSHPGMLATLAARLRGGVETGEDALQDRELNKRETEVLAAIAAGLTRRQAAEQLHLSVNTVKTYLRTAYRKLDARDRDEAIAVARAQGVLSAGEHAD